MSVGGIAQPNQIGNSNMSMSSVSSNAISTQQQMKFLSQQTAISQGSISKSMNFSKKK